MTQLHKQSCETCDVLVAGAGTAGVVAALQAARAGARTLLVEKNGFPGGTMTAGGVAFPGLFHAWGRQIIKGIGWELVTKCVEETGTSMPDFTTSGRPHYTYQVRIDPRIHSALCCEALEDSGCNMLFHAMLAGVRRNSGSWTIDLCTKTGIRSVSANVLIDCTGDANLTMLAGAPVRVIEDPQPATLVYRVSGYTPDAVDADSLNRVFRNQVESGNVAFTDIGWNTDSGRLETWLGNHGENVNHYSAKAAHTSEGKTNLELSSRLSLLRLYRLLKKQPGLENLKIDNLAPECGVRETVTIVGRDHVTVEDYTSGRKWNDAVCWSFYPVDLHKTDGSGLDCRPLENGVVPSVPRGALLPKDSDRLLVAGRCISSDRLANSALRVQATCMATGQAAGALAALSASAGIAPSEVPRSELKSLLETHDAIVP